MQTSTLARVLRSLWLAVGFLAAFLGSSGWFENNGEIGAGHVAYAREPLPAAVKQLQHLHLSDYRGRIWELDDFRDHPILVVAVLGTECPLAKLYSQRLVEIEKDYSQRKVAFLGIDPNAQDSLAELASHARRFGIEFPLLRDPEQTVVQSLGAQRTPEVFVLDEKRQVAYHGRIDDQYGIGYARQQPTENFLRQAIDDLLQHRPIAVPHSAAVGCLIGKPKTGAAVKTGESIVSYSKDIAPIFRDACVQCHRPGQIGPFSMTQYSEVAPWAEMIAEVVAERRMPPWHANPDHGHFANDSSLSAQQRELIARWVSQGAPEGNPADLPQPKQYIDGWQLPREPDLVLNVSPKPFDVPATGEVRYQYFRIDPGFSEEKWVQAAQIVPGNRSVVHHVLVFVRPKGSRGNVAGERGFLFGYVPGSVAQPYPSGVAKRIPADSELIFQVHYTPVGTPQQDHSKIGFVFADPATIEREVMTTSAVETALNIPPNEANYSVSALLPENLPDCQLLGLAPHMHLRGKSFRYTAITPDKKRQILLDIPRYDFNWQTAYRLAQPLSLAAGSKILCEATFDNSTDNLNNPNPSARVRWGDQTTDEMMIGYFDILVPRSPGSKSTPSLQPDKDAVRRELVRRLLRDNLLEQLDANNDGKVERNEVPQRWQNRFDQLDIDGNGQINEAELRKLLEQ